MNRNPPRPRPIMRVSGNRSLREAFLARGCVSPLRSDPLPFVSLSCLPFGSVTAAQPGADKREFAKICGDVRCKKSKSDAGRIGIQQRGERRAAGRLSLGSTKCKERGEKRRAIPKRER